MTNFNQFHLEPPPPPESNIVPIPGGSTLKEGVFKSPNFVHNRKGWQVNSEGEAQFTKLLVRNNFMTVPVGGDIQSALNLMAETGGGEVQLGTGRFFPESNIVIPDDVTLRGAGSATIIDFNNQPYQLIIAGTDAYETGTIAVTSGSADVTGTGTTWTVGMIGQMIIIDGLWYPVVNVSSTTALTLAYPYVGGNLSGEAYAIATIVDGADIASLDVQNSTATGGAVYCAYLNNSNVDKVNIANCTVGFEAKHCSSMGLTFTGTIGCGTGIKYDNVGASQIADFYIVDSTNDGMDITSLISAEITNFSCTNNGGNGIKFTNCRNVGVIDFSIDHNGGHGIEMVSGNESIQIIIGNVSNSTGDGIKLTATSDTCSITNITINGSGGWGVNIANANCDKNILMGVICESNASGSLSDSGTGTLKSAAVNILP